MNSLERDLDMIRFQETSERKNCSELPSSTGFQDIKPTGSLSNEEALSFLTGLFSVDPEIRDMHAADEENLLTEIFGRSENEFDFNFEVDNEIQTVLHRFAPTKWEKMSGEEKETTISELVAVIGRKLGLDENPTVHYYDGQNGSYGAYLPEKNCIEINRGTLFDAKEVVDTVAHEMRHAYQYQRAMCCETMQDKLYLLNFENYISPIPLSDGKYLLFTDYQDQLVEAEARAFANLFTSKEAA